MVKKVKEFTSSDLNVQDNSVCIWTNAMDDTLVDAYCHEDALGHRVGGTFTTHAMDNIVKELRSKFSNKVINKEKIHNRMKAIKKQFTKFYDTFHQSEMSGFAWDPITHKWDAKPEVWAQLIQLVTLYEKDRATGKHAETGSDMLKRNTYKNSRKSSVDSLTIDEIDDMDFINIDSLEDMEGHEQGDQTQAYSDVPTPTVYSEEPTPSRNKKSKHDHLEGITDMLRGGMDNLVGAINRLSPLPPISETEIWNMLDELDLEPSVNIKAYIFLCQNDVVAEPSPDEQTEDDEYDHSFILKDDIGYVCRICEVSKRSIDDWDLPDFEIETVNINNCEDLFLESSRLNEDVVALYKRCGHLTNGRSIMQMKDLSWA
ncbi:hypothetical protein FXO37_15738 [Capsicum annuum]|nr:hypothetical protein FXO37_15738 [Capsicum annuum]